MTSDDQQRGVRELFAAGGDAYDARQYGVQYRTYIADRQRLVSRVFRGLGLPPGARVLDVACGPGHFLLEASSLGFATVGTDYSESMLQTSAKRLGRGANLARSDAFALPFATAAFDAVNCSGLIEYFPDPVPALREIRRVLKPGARALVSSTNRLSPALTLSPIIDAIRRSSFARTIIGALRLPFDDMTLRERKFRLTFHTPRRLKTLFREAGFGDPTLHYYHLQLVPHPFDRLAPAIATACVAVTDKLLGVPGVRSIAEGLLAEATAP